MPADLISKLQRAQASAKSETLIPFSSQSAAEDSMDFHVKIISSFEAHPRPVV